MGTSSLLLSCCLFTLHYFTGPVGTGIKTDGILVFPLAEILKELHIDLADQEFRQLAEKYDIQNIGMLSYLDFLRHFVLFLHPQTKQALEKPKLNEKVQYLILQLFTETSFF